ncbi:similar to Saccharomyces cerevisiae YDR155C CPR1 Cytoplasmic peptidyl-prolyl cis-trans isomerase (cyclophilin) [Geotrichum candidum]|uniref:peptidylprolyl isomerase n=1 Tax=Geotrichum candidum TaxID=1173061 RepID=A0A0J9XHC8_GEOCN|nr:similar to Saccharomyces cerevisiae YDR155C CPR1 Cytoplasmic peptidyl-prolyl cis-trans isomerase (cyclophilin) [Geotrichum candidum]
MSTRPRVFLDIESRVSSGRVFFELYNDLAPKASENFRCLCVGDQISRKASPANDNTDSGTASESKKSKKQKQKKFSLKNVRFHRVVAPEFIVQAGEDLDGESIYYNAETKSYYFPGENNSEPVNESGILCMANENGDPDKNTSQFFITLQKGLGIEGCTVFGRVIRGMEVLEGLEDVIVDEEDRPVQGDEVFIRRSGELELKKSKSVETANATTETATNENSNADTDEKPLIHNPSKGDAVKKLTKDETLNAQKSGDSTDKSSEQPESTFTEKKSESSENSRPSRDDNATSRRSRDDYDQNRSSRRERDERHRYDRDDRSRYNKDDRSRYDRDNRGYERNDRGRYDRCDRAHSSRDEREDRRGRWDDRRLQAPRKYEDRSEDKSQPKVIFKGRGSMKYKDREFGRL